MSTRAGTARRLSSNSPRQPRVAWRAGSGAEQDVPVASLNPGESIIIRPGDRIPVDATVLSGESAVMNPCSPENPCRWTRAPVQSFYTGTANTNGRLVARVEATGESTALAHIIAAVQRAQSSRAQVQRLADRVVPCLSPSWSPSRSPRVPGGDSDMIPLREATWAARRGPLGNPHTRKPGRSRSRCLPRS